MNAADLVTYVRVLTGLARNDVVSTNTILRWLDEAYTEVARERAWRWLEITQRGDLPAWVEVNSSTSGEFLHGYHPIQLNTNQMQVISAYLVTPSGDIKEMVEVPEYDHIDQNDPTPQYKIYNSGLIRVSPKQEDGCTYRVRYIETPASLNFAVENDDGTFTYTVQPSFDAQFHPILAYRVAAKVLQFIADDTPRAELYMREYDTLLMGMIKYYELSNDYNTFSIGQDGVESRRYIPWFRPA